jgi:hypothetical protein
LRNQLAREVSDKFTMNTNSAISPMMENSDPIIHWHRQRLEYLDIVFADLFNALLFFAGQRLQQGD